jgi:RNA polymerase sigma-70 factor (ECF subfamily)
VDEQGFLRQVTPEITRLRRLAHRVACPSTDPDDLVQDTLERAWNSRDRFRADAEVTTWLHRILVNRAIDLCRRSARNATVALDADTLETLADVEIDDLDALLERASDAADLRAAMSRLPTDERMVLSLHDGEGWTARRIGEICGLPTATIHKRLQRGRLHLARELNTVEDRPHSTAGTCLQVRTGASDYIDGILEDTARHALEEHVRGCPRCPSLVQALIGIRDALARAEVPIAPPGDLAETLRALRATW